MALAATTILDARNGGSDSNGGGFDPGNGNMATDLAATSANTSAPVVTSASYNFSAGDVGHWLFVKSGTNWTPGWYQVASVATNAATLAATAGSGYIVGNNVPIGPTTAVGCATTASPTAGTWSMDYSQTTSARLAFTDMVIDGTTNTKFTSAGNPVGKNHVGNVINVTSGTGFTVQRVQISSVTGTAATCDKSLGTLSSTGGVGNLGGCLASLGIVGGFAANACPVFLKYNATAYSMSNTANVSGGRLNTTGFGGLAITGWNTNRHVFNVDASRPILDPGAASMVLLAMYTGSGSWIANLSFTNSAARAGIQYITGNVLRLRNCKFTGATGVAVTTSGGLCSATDCEWSGGSTDSFSPAGGASMKRCTVHDQAAGIGVAMAGNADLTDVAVVNHGGSACYGTSVGGSHVTMSRCTGHIAGSGTGSGISVIGTYLEAYDCLMVGGGGVGGIGFKLNSQQLYCQLFNCAAYNFQAGSNNFPTAGAITGLVTLSASPFTNAAGNDFSLNTTAGGGSACRGAGTPGAYLGLSTTSYPDIGAVQHQDSGGGGVFPVIGSAFIRGVT